MSLPQPTGPLHRIALDVIRDFPPSALFDFNTKTSDAEFLFESEVVEYLAQIRKRAVHMQAAERIFEPLPVGDERSVTSKQRVTTAYGSLNKVLR